MSRTDQSLIAIRRMLRATELHGRKLAQAAGLTPVQIRVLQIVAESGHATARDISRRMGVSPATMTVLVDKLVAKGMVERKQSATDRRQTDIVITDRGATAVADAPDPLQQAYVRQFESMEDWEQAMVVSVLERVADMLDPSGLDAAPVLDTGDFLTDTRGADG